MNDPGQALTRADADVYPIREVARLTGVNPVTLRAWERRYGLLRPQRTPKGHRLYSRRDVERIRRILRLVDRGVPVGQVRGVLDGPEAMRRPRSNGAFGSEFESLRRDLLRAAERFAPAALEQALGRGFAELPLDVLYRRVLEPTREQLRSETERGGMPVSARAYFESRLEQRLAARLGRDNSRQPTRRAGVWLQGLPGETDAIELLIHAVACGEAGLDPVALTAPAPVQGLYDVIGANAAAAIVLVGRSPAIDFATAQALRDVVRNPDIPCLVAGPAAVLGQDTFTELGCETLPAFPSAAAERVRERIRAAGSGVREARPA